MICPYRKRTEVRTDRYSNKITLEKYMPCYKEECPYYSDNHMILTGKEVINEKDVCEKARREING